MPGRERSRTTHHWERESAGRYRSGDDRFEIESDGGRWFLRDELQRDELGMARTTGPYGSLAAGKEAAAARRTEAEEPSPLAPRVRARARRTDPEAARDTAGHRRPPERQTWIDRLAETDRGHAALARRWVDELTALGIDGADDIVRRDVLGGMPEVAAALLRTALGRRLTAALSDLDTGSFEIAERTLAVVLDELASRERLVHAPADLPGWRLVEVTDGREGRRIVLDAGDGAG